MHHFISDAGVGHEACFIPNQGEGTFGAARQVETVALAIHLTGTAAMDGGRGYPALRGKAT